MNTKHLAMEYERETRSALCAQPAQSTVLRHESGCTVIRKVRGLGNAAHCSIEIGEEQDAGLIPTAGQVRREGSGTNRCFSSFITENIK